jgi:hypothetical protein
MFLTNALIVTIAILLPLVPVVMKAKSYCSWSWAKVLILGMILFMVTIGTGHWILNITAREMGVLWNPDNTRKVVIYQLPFRSFTPGSGSDGPGFVKVYDEKGNCLASIKFELIQMAQVTWFDDAVEIGSTTVRYR